MCATPSEDCWLNACDNCKDAQVLRQNYDLELSQPVSWYEWRRDENGSPAKVENEGFANDLFNHICLMLPQFFEHCYVKRNQAESYNEEKKYGW